MVSWWAAKRCAGRAASFALLLILALNPLAAAGQTRCETAAARIVSAEGDVSIIGPVRGAVQPVSAGELSEVCSGETVLVGPRSRAAVRLEDTGQVIRLDQGTTLRVLPPRQPGRPLLDLSRGIIDLFSPAGRPLDVQTPYVTAGVEGTEFFVVVNPLAKLPRSASLKARWASKMRKAGSRSPQARRQLPRRAWHHAVSRSRRAIRSDGRSIIRRRCGSSPPPVRQSTPRSTEHGRHGGPALSPPPFGRSTPSLRRKG